VVSNNVVDDVLLSAIVFKNIYARKSLSVHHMQRRLAELGYDVVSLDKDGFYGDRTKEALSSFQADNHLPGDGHVDVATLTKLFDGDPNVRLVL
jgi:peptidoglycan hydrolase-like protein with peptidoglycan-binding domain